jgi:hypothetical protein
LFKYVIYQIDDISCINIDTAIAITINFPVFEHAGRRTELENIVDQIDCVPDIQGRIAVCIARFKGIGGRIACKDLGYEIYGIAGREGI